MHIYLVHSNAVHSNYIIVSSCCNKISIYGVFTIPTCMLLYFDNIIVNFSIIINVISSNSEIKWGKIQKYMHPSNMKWKQGEIKANKFISWVLNLKITRSQVGKKMLHFLYKYTFALNIHRTSIVYALFIAQFTKNMK